MQSDFDMGGITFSRQHDIRCREQNETHTTISFLNNAKGQDKAPPSADFSSGFLISLHDEKDAMKATLLQQYDHPMGGVNDPYAPRRGNMQILDNGNVFMGWSERATQSEHDANGTLLMEARFRTDWIGSYRNYKFPYVGKPTTLPDVHSAAYLEDINFELNPETRVWVSWNGDTEVKKWNLYGSKMQNGTMELIESKDRTGFETSFIKDSYVRTVRLEGVDANGNKIANSGPVRTIPHPNMPEEVENMIIEDEQGRELNSASPPVWFIVLLILGGLTGAALILLTWFGVFRVPSLDFVTRIREKLDRREISQYNQLDLEEQNHEQKQSLIEDQIAQSESFTVDESDIEKR